MTKHLKSKQEIVKAIWNSHPDYLGASSSKLQKTELVDLWANLFCPGPFFYYVLDSPTLTIDLVSGSTKAIVGISQDQLSLVRLIDRIHPEDLNFFYRCEDVVAHFLWNRITPDKVVKYKISYCLRMRASADVYKLILLQTITLKTTAEGSLLKVFSSHTDISHITTNNNFSLALLGWMVSLHI